jgi:glycosyltransferase involved in cell wall biosynthesis
MWVCETLVDGLPLIAADSGGTPELVDDRVTGILFRSGNVEDLTTNLIKVAADPSGLNAMRRHAFARGQKLFRLERFIRQTVEAYSALIPRTTIGKGI